jgi:uncharacterized protein YdhG (YjbR/CyaY superfamily)
MKKVSSVPEYISSAPKKSQRMIKQLRSIVKSLAPKAEEVISYHMPLYKHKGRLVYFGACEGYCAIYILPKDKKLAKEIEPYKKGKSTVHFSTDKPLPVALVKKIIKSRLKENESKFKTKTKK